MSTYRALNPIDRSEALEGINSADPSVVGDAVLRLALHDPDGDWVTDQALELLHHPDSNVRAVATTALGHVARIHRRIDLDRVVPALRSLTADPSVAGRAEDALDDIQTFVQRGTPRPE